MSLSPTTTEARAIRELEALAKRWPSTLWLYSVSGSLCVMRYADDGDRARLAHGCMDPESVLATINIPNDGGDW